MFATVPNSRINFSFSFLLTQRRIPFLQCTDRNNYSIQILETGCKKQPSTAIRLSLGLNLLTMGSAFPCFKEKYRVFRSEANCSPGPVPHNPWKCYHTCSTSQVSELSVPLFSSEALPLLPPSSSFNPHALG